MVPRPLRRQLLFPLGALLLRIALVKRPRARPAKVGGVLGGRMGGRAQLHDAPDELRLAVDELYAVVDDRLARVARARVEEARHLPLIRR